jgi:hypothetical protein
MADDRAGREAPAGDCRDGVAIQGRVAVWDIDDGAALLAEEVRMGLEIGAIPGGLAVVIDRAHEPAFGKSLEAIVNGGEGDAGELFLDPEEDVDGGGVIPFQEEGVVDFAALRRKPESLLGNGLVAAFTAAFSAGLAMGLREHRFPKISGRMGSLSRTILNKKREPVSRANSHAARGGLGGS